MGISVIQTSFANGEMSPSLFGRVDIARYSIGLKTCRNFIVKAGGGAWNRPGTRYVDSTPSDAKVRLIRFKFSIDDACLLIFGDHLMRVVRNGAYILSGGVPYEIATPWGVDDLPLINITQSADVMTIVHPLYRPRELKRFANDNWTITEPTYLPTIAAPASATATATPGTGTLIPWQYQITAVYDDASSIQESLPVTSNNIMIGNPAQASVTWSAVPGATYYNVYKDNSGAGVFGFTGRATTLSFSDNNIVPTKTDTPPTGLDPFVGAGNYPGAVGYYQQRKVYGGSLNKPQTLWFSRTGQFNNFGYSTPNKDDDAITWTMASTEVNRILNLLPLRQLITLTNGAEWSIIGGTAGFTAKTINGNPQSYNGSGYIQPLVLNDTALYLLGGGQSVAGLNYSLESDGLASEDLTIWSSHLFRNYSVMDWAYQKRSDSIVWSVRSDGKLLGLTYLRAQEVVAWHRHDTDGFIESVAVIPEGSDDVVYLCVRRVINGVTRRYIERMLTRQIPFITGVGYTTDTPDVAQAYFVDCGLSYQGWNPNPTTLTLTGGTAWAYPEELSITASANQFSLADVGRQIHIRDLLTLEVLRLDIVAFVSPTNLTVIPTGLVPESLRGITTTSWGMALRTFSGLSHLEGKGVAILADGNVVGTNDPGEENLVVTGGSVTIPDHAAVCHIGLPYSSDLETLRINVSGQETLFDKYKTINSVSVVLEESRGLFAGKDANNLWEWKQREFENYNSPTDLSSSIAKVSITNDWDGQGQVFIRQQDPLPLTILGIIPELTIAGKT